MLRPVNTMFVLGVVLTLSVTACGNDEEPSNGSDTNTTDANTTDTNTTDANTTDATATDATPTGGEMHIKDTVANWSLGAAELVVDAYDAELDDYVDIANGTISAAGEIDLILPAVLPDGVLEDVTDLKLWVDPANPCSNDITASTLDARLIGINRIWPKKNGESIGFLAQPAWEAPVPTAERYYTNIALKIEGTCTFSDGDGTYNITMALDMAPGWNIVESLETKECPPGTDKKMGSGCTWTASAKTVTETTLPWVGFDTGLEEL